MRVEAVADNSLFVSRFYRKKDYFSQIPHKESVEKDTIKYYVLSIQRQGVFFW